MALPHERPLHLRITARCVLVACSRNLVLSGLNLNLTWTSLLFCLELLVQVVQSLLLTCVCGLWMLSLCVVDSWCGVWFGFSWSVAEVKHLKQDSSGRLECINTKPVCLGQAVSEPEPCARMTHTNREVLQLFNCVASLLLPWRNASLAGRFAGSSVFALLS